MYQHPEKRLFYLWYPFNPWGLGNDPTVDYIANTRKLSYRGSNKDASSENLTDRYSLTHDNSHK
eukprot:10844708-Lingulodinium_polyedra.AAC.1